MSEYDNAAQMPTTYDTGPTQSTVSGAVDMDFIKSLPGILQISQIALSLTLFICASVNCAFVSLWGGGWVQFVSMSAFLICFIMFVIYAFNLVEKIPSSIPRPLVVLCMILFICASVHSEFVWWYGGGWVQFCSMSAFIFSIIIFVLYAFEIVHRLPQKVPRALIELIYYSVYTLFFFICGIVSAVFGWRHSSIGASAFFSFACMIVFGVDIFFKFQSWRVMPPAAPQMTSPTSPAAAEAGRPTTTNVDKMQY